MGHDSKDLEKTPVVEHDTALSRNEAKVETPINLEECREKTILRRIDALVLPLLCILWFLQYLDKSTLNFAGVLGIYEDTGIDHNQFGWIGSIFYLGFLLFQISNSYLMPVLPVSKYLGVLVCAWGVVLACTSLCKTFQSLFGLRIVLGFLEASSYPISFHLISLLYRRREHVLRIGLLQCSNSLCGALGGLIGYGIGLMDGVAGLRGWRWCMILCGAFTVLWGSLIFVFLPDRAKSRWFRLTQEEQAVVDDRSRDNAVVLRHKVYWDQVIEGVHDQRLYIYFFLSCLINLTTGALSLFRSQIIKQMGFSNLDSLLLDIPHGAANILINVSCMLLSYRFKEVGFVGALSTSITFLGGLLLLVLPQNGTRLIGLYLANNVASNILIQTYITNNVSGITKKTLFTGINLVGYTVGHFVGPLTMRQENAPRYIPAVIAYMVASVIAMFLFLYLRWSYSRENKQRRGAIGHTEEELAYSLACTTEEDITDKQNVHFIYKM
ncbi:major facilitator superfamily domain-containing protein [Syncephalastrum racemosum]|uniref:Major facilitator superfamily domain-containing protein n=1 Tax=Syncephalastrum racemosum TaxID=13706 RepID=A0A1X2HEY7_SYNRA|nr:major facilitator superfamily domain-containing protein [Syncephalastrum racemosum]